MKRLVLLVLATVLVLPQFADSGTTGKILIVVSNRVDMGDPEKHDARNNLWEVAPPYHVFLMHGYEVEFVSPAGGAVEFYMDPVGISSYTIRYEAFLDRASRSRQPGQLDPDDYRAVYIGGGYGTLFDVASNEKMLSLIAAIYERGGIVGACGHGAGGFANARLRNGEYMVSGKRVAGFPDDTERSKDWAKQGTLLPFLVESRLRNNGAIALNKGSVADKHDVVIDQRIVSTMFLPSAALVAKEMIGLLEHR